MNILKRVSSRERGSRSNSPAPTSSRRSSFSALFSAPSMRDQSPGPVGPLRKESKILKDIPIQLGPPSSDSTATTTPTDSDADADSDTMSSSDSGSDDDDDDGDLEDADFDDPRFWGEETTQNTELNALSPELEPDDPLADRDPLGEGVNVLFAKPEPHFTARTHTHHAHADHNQQQGGARSGLPLTTARPAFSRDCCTVVVTHGAPAQYRTPRSKTYVVCSDLSAHARFALDWAIGVILRDGDELVVATVLETDTKIDPGPEGPFDHVAKLKNQQERETHAYLLSRQVISILQRTRLHVRVLCQAWHAKNMRHHILDLVDLIEPAMLIVGSRGVGDIKGILLGSTSHYLVQRSSVPVMVARRRLKKAARRTAHLERDTRTAVPLAQARVEKEATHIEKNEDQLDEEDAVVAAGAEDDPDTTADPDTVRGRTKVRAAA